MIDSYIKAGKIVSKIRKDASKMIKEGLPVIDLVEFVEGEIIKSGAGIAFPCNVSINEVAAHYTSPLNDETLIYGGDLVKLDLGAEVDGYIADSAITILAPGKNLDERFDDDTLNLNQEIIEASAAGLEAAISTVRAGVEIGKIGAAVEEAINEYELNPIANLTGHSLEYNNLHAGLSIPNINNHDTTILEEEQAIAIEPFATNGVGWVNDSPGTYIYSYLADKPFRMKNTQKTPPFHWKRELYQSGIDYSARASASASSSLRTSPFAELRMLTAFSFTISIFFMLFRISVIFFPLWSAHVPHSTMATFLF